MPIYEYECKRCGSVFEELQQLSDPPPKTCQSCGSKRIKRLMSRSSFILKGDGWYLTDYARKEKKSTSGGAEGKKKKDSSATSKETTSKSKGGGDKSAA